jgi:hypothetical protein
LEASTEDPIRLLYSLGPSLAWLPVGLLTVGGGEGDLHVIERAIPQAMAAEIDQSPKTLDGFGTLAVIDPTNDFPQMHDLAPIADQVLAGPELQAKPEGAGAIPASEGALLSALAGGDRSDVFLYVGHAKPSDVDYLLKAGLAIGLGHGRDATLTVDELIRAAPQLRPPRRAILCACSTAGGVDHTYERWGLPTALLVTGCRELVATLWDVHSSKATADLMTALLVGERTDLAAALRRAQLNRLRNWRADVSAGQLDYDDENPSCAHPFLWAPFVAIGYFRP